MEANDKLQELCRDYLSRLKGVAKKHGLATWLNATIKANARKECRATEEEVELLSRMVDEERIARNEIPKLAGTSYRKCNEGGYFDKIRKLKPSGIYSKVSAILLFAQK